MPWPSTRGSIGIVLRVVALLLLAPLASNGYEQRLSPGAIRDAYNLGRKHDADTAAFLAQYFRRLATPLKGPYVESIEVLTPYAQLVNAAMLGMGNENIYDVQRKYAARPGTLVVRVRVYSAPATMLPSSNDDIWKEFPVRVLQVIPLKFEKKSVNHVYPSKESGGSDYADIELQFNAKNVASAPITIEVSTPGSQRVEEVFDLSKLK